MSISPSIVLWWRWTWGFLSESGVCPLPLEDDLGLAVASREWTYQLLGAQVHFNEHALAAWAQRFVCGLSLCWIWIWTSWKGYCNTKVTLVFASSTSRTVSDARVQLSQVTAHFGTHQCSSSGMGYRHRQFQRGVHSANQTWQGDIPYECALKWEKYVYNVYMEEFPLQIIAMCFHKSRCCSINGNIIFYKLRISSIHGIPIIVPDCQRDILYFFVKAGARPDGSLKEETTRVPWFSMTIDWFRKKTMCFLPL